jgi:hypothetical protein
MTRRWWRWAISIIVRVRSREQSEYRLGVTTDDQALQFPEGTALDTFQWLLDPLSVSRRCPERCAFLHAGNDPVRKTTRLLSLSCDEFPAPLLFLKMPFARDLSPLLVELARQRGVLVVVPASFHPNRDLLSVNVSVHNHVLWTGDR